MSVTVSSERQHGPTRPEGTGRRVMVGVDGSPAGRAALAEAGRAARADRLEVVAVHVRRGLTPMEALGYAFAGGVGSSWLDGRDDGELSAWLDCVQVLESGGVRWQFQVRSGDPVEQLRSAAEMFAVRSVYLAARTRHWWTRHFHRCPAHALARGVRCPVHVVAYSERAGHCLR